MDSSFDRVVMVRYGELFLKSEPVKRHFIGLIIRSIKKALDSRGIAFRYETPRGRILLYGDEPEEIATEVARIFGVIDVSVAAVTGTGTDALSDAALSFAEGRMGPGTRFAVRAKRQKGAGGPDSQELGAIVGSALCMRYPDAVVDLTNPEYEVFVEVREHGGFVYDARLPAPGGLPFGSQGTAIGLLSSGIDSPVASWLMMKRGCRMVHLNMDGGAWAGDATSAGAIENHRRLSLWVRGYPLRMLVVHSAPFYDALSRGVPRRFTCILCKRFMFRAAARLMPGEEAHALVTGENLGQVASQTLKNLAVISSATTVPVIRPLVTFDKQEIVTLARKIGTFNPKPGDLCCRAVPPMPATEADQSEIETLEEKVRIEELLDSVLGQVRVVTAQNGEIMIHDKPE